MDWQRDPKTGEWVAIDPMTQGMTGAEPDPSLRDPLPAVSPAPGQGEGYSDPAVRTMPAPARPMPADDGSYSDPGLRAIPLSPPDAGAYQNEDYDAIDQWVREVQARGNEIRKTAAGTFEVDANGRIVSEMPKPQYRMN